MRIRTSTAAAVCVVTAGLAAGGCASNATNTASTSPSTTTPAASSGATGSSSTAQAAASGSTCQVSNLAFALGTKSGGASQSTQPVDMTNTGSSTCTMDGFPGVDLVGAANGQQDYSWSMARSSASYGRVTLQPGGTAHFDLDYLPDSSSSSADMAVVKLVITPPNTYTQAEVTWSQSVLLQDGATHPGTYITPVVSGT